MTFCWLSRTGSEVIPSLFITSSAAVRGLSPLHTIVSERQNIQAVLLLDSDNLVGTNIQVLQASCVKWFDRGEAAAVLEEETQYAQLCENSNHLIAILFCHRKSMYSASKHLNRFG